MQADAVTTIIDAFRTHSVVGLDEVHGDERSHAFRLRLIRDPRFAAIISNFVVEFGNSRYQDVIDQFVNGDTVADADLKKVWQNTTQAHTIWDRQIYEAFFRSVRALNLTLPRERRLRVLLGDPPIDWDAVRTPEDRLRWLQIGAQPVRRGYHPQRGPGEASACTGASTAPFTSFVRICRAPI